MNLFSLAKKFPTEDLALLHLIKTRWPRGVRCVACDHDKCWLIEAKGTTGKPRKLFQCAECGYQFSATANTLFHDSHLPLTKWFAAIALMAEAKKGIAANQVKRHVGLTYKTAWYVCHRIREAMQEESGTVLGGEATVVEIDETYIGGRTRCFSPNTTGMENKTMVLGIAERNGRLHMQVLKNRGRETMRTALESKIHPETQKFVTDGAPVYAKVLPKTKHVAGNHREELKIRTGHPHRRSRTLSPCSNEASSATITS